MAKPRPRTRSTVANKVKSLMVSRGMTQRDLAADSGVSQRQISNIVRGENSPSVEIVEAIAKTFGTQGWQLLNPHIPANYKYVHALNDLILAYTQANDDVRRYIDTIIERERKLDPPQQKLLTKIPEPLNA